MSSKLHGLVWEGCAHAGLILSRVAVMARLADYSNDEGVSWPAVETIQRQIGARSKNTVSAAIDDLVRDGWLTKTERKSGGRNLSNVYQINVDKLEEAAAAARMANKSKKRSERVTPPTIDPPTVDGLTVDPSNIDPPIVDGSTIDKNTPIEGSMADPDPSVNTDPSVKRSTPPSPQGEGIAEQVSILIDHLNQNIATLADKLGKPKPLGFRKGTSAAKQVAARLREGFTVEDCLLVMDYLSEMWGADPEMREYLCPTTIFRASKFDERVVKATNWSNAGRPSRCGNSWNRGSASPFGASTGPHWNSPEGWESTL
ncbi:conserved phage C-terminal domain-containing protein [Edwardsiella tarda]